jgi:hemin uptake protein HemP
VFASLIAFVLLGHWTILTTAPRSEGEAFPADDTAHWVFTTRSIEPPKAGLAPEPAPISAQKPPLRKTRMAQATSPSVPAIENVSALERDFLPVAIGDTAPENATPSPVEPVPLTAADIPDATISSSTKEAVASSVVIPKSVQLKYEVKGVVSGTSYTGSGELLWQHDGKVYNARLAISKFSIPLRVQTSEGQLSAQGLEPTRFGDRKRGEVAAHFERHLNKIVFSANTPDAPLLPGGQDQLSVFIQLAALMAGAPGRYPPGSTLTLQAVGSHYSEQWTIVFGDLDKASLPGGEVSAIRLTREPEGEHDTKVETWFAPDMEYLPVHIRLSKKNGDFVDMLWSSIE